MKKSFFLILLLSQTIFSQITFEKGYFINNENIKIDCLLKNMDWLNNPDSFIYKINDNDEEKTGNLNNVLEFGINNQFKYINRKVSIDKSSSKISELSNDKNPKFVEETLFLKVLIEGKASLFEYIHPGFTKYFYTLNNSDIAQLFFKEYNFEKGIKRNEEFKKQLFKDLKCTSIRVSEINYLAYKKNDLIDIFIKYNTCSNTDFTNYNKKNNRTEFNLSVRGRYNLPNIEIIHTSISSLGIEFKNTSSFGIGIEAEYVLPFNKNKWSIIFEPTYQTTFSDGIRDRGDVTLKHSSIEIPIGLRHYLFLNDNSKLFVNGSIYMENNFNSGIFNKNNNTRALEINSGIFLGLGLGYKFMDTYSFEVRYISNRGVLNDYQLYLSNYKTISFILGYTLF